MNVRLEDDDVAAALSSIREKAAVLRMVCAQILNMSVNGQASMLQPT